MLVLVPKVAPRGLGFARGAWPFIGQLPKWCMHGSVCACVNVHRYGKCVCVSAACVSL